MNISHIDRDLHAQAMSKGHIIIAGLIANKLITTGAKLGADQRANPAWHEAKRKEFKRIKDAHLFRIELHDWKDRLTEKWNPEVEEKWEHGRHCDCDYCDNPAFANWELM